MRRREEERGAERESRASFTARHVRTASPLGGIFRKPRIRGGAQRKIVEKSVLQRTAHGGFGHRLLSRKAHARAHRKPVGPGRGFHFSALRELQSRRGLFDQPLQLPRRRLLFRTFESEQRAADRQKFSDALSRSQYARQYGEKAVCAVQGGEDFQETDQKGARRGICPSGTVSSRYQRTFGRNSEKGGGCGETGDYPCGKTLSSRQRNQSRDQQTVDVAGHGGIVGGRRLRQGQPRQGQRAQPMDVPRPSLPCGGVRFPSKKRQPRAVGFLRVRN